MTIDATTLTRIDDAFRSRVAGNVAPASAYAIFDRKGVIASNGFGLVGNEGQPPTKKSLFRIASCTKSFTSAAVLQLRDSGRIALDDRLDSILDIGPLDLFGEQTEPPTLRMLLSMTGGFPNDDAWADRQESMASANFDRLAARGFTLSSLPGTRYQYSNLGYALLGRVIETVTGKSFQDYVTEDLLKPLGFDAIGFDQSVGKLADLVVGFDRSIFGWAPQPLSGPGAFSSIGGLFASLESLSSWARWLMSAFEQDVEDNPVLSARSRREMQSPAVFPATEPGETSVGRSYGLGLVIEHDHRFGAIVSHSGGYPGYSSHMRWSPQAGLGIVAFENATYSGAEIPAREGLEAALATDYKAHPSTPVLWERTVQAREAVEQYLEGSVAHLESLFADNVHLDTPLGQRADKARELVTGMGTISGSIERLDRCDPQSYAPSHLEWTIRGTTGAARCEITLTPHVPPLIQTIRFSSLPGPSEQIAIIG